MTVIGRFLFHDLVKRRFSVHIDVINKGIEKEGAFYLFPKAPVADDVAFVRALQDELILVVPGSGFGGPGHFRIAFCVTDDTIKNAMPGFRRTLERHR